MSDDRVKKVLLVHGWAGCPGLWSRISRRLADLAAPDHPRIDMLNLGYYGNARSFSGSYDVAVGHSAGVAWILGQPTLRFERLVSLAGFTRFCRDSNPGNGRDSNPDNGRGNRRGPAFAAGWPPRTLQRMREALAADAPSVLQEFWNNASTRSAGHSNFPLPDSLPDSERLQSGLQALSSVDCREQWNRFSGPRMVVAGTEDRIVTAAHTESCFPNEPIEWIKTDSHWLPWTFPETCAQLLHEMIRK